jgi:hypothetical protein
LDKDHPEHPLVLYGNDNVEVKEIRAADGSGKVLVVGAAAEGW